MRCIISISKEKLEGGILESCWYENRPLGVNKLSTMMKDISAAAELSKIYINHSVRASAITLWSQAGLSNRQIMAISGHRNETSLRSYNNQHSTSQLRQCSNVLAHALGDLNASTDQSQESRSQNQLSTTFALPCRERLHKLQALKWFFISSFGRISLTFSVFSEYKIAVYT